MSDVLVTVVGGKGSPGSTTTALALATFADRPAYMIEADSFGGDLAYRCRHGRQPLAESPNVLTMTAAVRHGPADDVLPRYSHTLGDDIRIVPGHLAAEQSFNTDWQPLGRSLAASRFPVVIDVGRVHTASPTLPLVVKADVVVPVLRADVTSVMRTLDQLDRLVPELAARRDDPPILQPVVVAPPRHASVIVREVRELLAGSRVAPAVRGVGWVAYDEPGATSLYIGRTSRRSRLAVSVRDLWTELRPADAMGIAVTGTPAFKAGVARAET